jgi:hypothetical protein
MSGATRAPPSFKYTVTGGLLTTAPPAAQKVSTPACNPRSRFNSSWLFAKSGRDQKKKKKKGEERSWWLVQSGGGGENFCFSPLGGPVSNIILPEEVLFSGELFHFVKQMGESNIEVIAQRQETAEQLRLAATAAAAAAAMAAGIVWWVRRVKIRRFRHLGRVQSKSWRFTPRIALGPRKGGGSACMYAYLNIMSTMHGLNVTMYVHTRSFCTWGASVVDRPRALYPFPNRHTPLSDLGVNANAMRMSSYYLHPSAHKKKICMERAGQCSDSPPHR